MTTQINPPLKHCCGAAPTLGGSTTEVRVPGADSRYEPNFVGSGSRHKKAAPGGSGSTLKVAAPDGSGSATLPLNKKYDLK